MQLRHANILEIVTVADHGTGEVATRPSLSRIWHLLDPQCDGGSKRSIFRSPSSSTA